MEHAGEKRPVGRGDLPLRRQAISYYEVEREQEEKRQDDQQSIAQYPAQNSPDRWTAGATRPCWLRDKCCHNILPLLSVIASLCASKRNNGHYHLCLIGPAEAQETSLDQGKDHDDDGQDDGSGAAITIVLIA